MAKPQLSFMSDSDVVDRVLGHVAAGTTDRGTEVWREPVDNYRLEDRLTQELNLFKSVPTAFCPSIALAKPGDYIARNAAGTPLIVVRGKDGHVRAFKNACRHRGSELVAGKGCAGAFVCPYHGWSYGLDGALLGIPHEGGFPDIDKLAHGLREVMAIETKGMVFVIQEPGANEHEALEKAMDMLAGVPDVLTDDQILFAESEIIVEANWKIHMESFLEGYHIKATHKETFFPFGYDNLNVIEFCGPHARVTFPFQRIEKLADVPAEERDVSDKLTYLNHMFPNVALAELSHHRTLAMLEPLGVGRTKVTSYHLTKSSDNPDKDAVLESAKRDLAFVNEVGNLEDIAMVSGIQRSLNSGANEAFTFGLNEPAIVHFHQHIAEMLGQGD
jgi:phenylpropionate dioxygenase-like ring-hydroxylating dioxygenase large terminal subunit